jgi:homocysteine S-methyltransferase
MLICDARCHADMVSAFTLTNIDEVIGIVRGAEKQKIPCAISFTVETSKRLPRRETLQQEIEYGRQRNERSSRIFHD